MYANLLLSRMYQKKKKLLYKTVHATSRDSVQYRQCMEFTRKTHTHTHTHAYTHTHTHTHTLFHSITSSMVCAFPPYFFSLRCYTPERAHAGRVGSLLLSS